MPENAQLILSVGAILLLGMAAHQLGRRTPLPRVSLLVIFGIIVGPGVLNLIPEPLVGNFDLIATIALLMIGFLLGGKLTKDSLRRFGNSSIVVSLVAAAGTAGVVCVTLLLLDIPAALALLLGCIAAATAPAATFDLVAESGTRSRFADLLLIIVALDDIWGVILFSFALAAATAMQGGSDALSPLLDAARDICGGTLIGLAIGLPAAYLTGRIKPGEPIVSEALGLALLCGGMALWTDTSFLIAAMVMGATIANLAGHHDYPFHAIENIESPFLIVFFVLAGASLELDAVTAAGLLGLAYLASRIAGKLLSAGLGARLMHLEPPVARWLGAALLPQAGIAVGMALVAANALPEYAPVLLPVVIAATVVFEILGPLGTRLALAATRD